MKSPQDCFTIRLRPRGLSGECLTGGPRRRQTPACRSSSLVFRSKKVIRSMDASPSFFVRPSLTRTRSSHSDCRRLRAVKSPQDCFTIRLRGLSVECLTGGLRRWQKLAQRKNRFIPKTTRRRECPLGGLSDRIFCFVPIILVSSGTITCPRNYPNSLLRAG